MTAPESDGLGGTTSTTLGDPPPREPPKPTAQPSMSESLARLIAIAAFLRTHPDAVLELVRAALVFGPLASDYANASNRGEWLDHHGGAIDEAREELGFAARRLVDPGAPGLYVASVPAPAPTADLPDTAE